MRTNQMPQGVGKYIKGHKRRKKWLTAVTGMACVVVFCVTYALILPAITMEGDTYCGFTEHQHGAECFEKRLICEIPEGEAAEEAHVHTEDCYEEVLVCQLEEHEHSLACHSNPNADMSDDLAAETMTEEEQTQVREIIARIDVLPTLEEIEETLTGYEETEDEDGYDAYLTEIMTQVSETYAAYSALTEAQRSAVTNSDQLLVLAEGLGINGMMLLTEGTEDVATPDGGFNGYVQAMNIKSMVTGSAPFDEDDVPGNDSSTTNTVVRTFDTISYEVEATYAQRSTAAMIAQNSELSFEISMEQKITEARFDTSTMSWLNSGEASWEIDYWARDPVYPNDPTKEYIVLVEKKDGEGTTLYRKDEATGQFTIPTSINAMVLGSTPTNGTAYQTSTGGIVRQTLTGKLNACPDGDAATGIQKFTTGVRVRNAKNGDTVTPSFKAWFTKNPENYGVITNGTSTEFSGNQAVASPVTVSCAPLYNLTLEESTEYVNYLSWYDFSSGNEVMDADLLAWLEAAGSLPENYGKANPSDYTNNGNDGNVASAYNKLTEEQKSSLANIRYGRMNALGITMSLASGVSDKGYKGCSLPVGIITFDLALGVNATTRPGEGDVNTVGYSAILWDYRPNVSFGGVVGYPEAGKTRGVEDPSKGNMGRNLRWREIDFSQYGSRMAPAAYRGNTTTDEATNTTVYDSGNWSLTQINGAGATASTAANTNSVYTFTVHDYDFDLDNYLYPDRYYGASGPDGTLRVTDFAFFGGFAQVLYVMPYANSGTVDVSRQLTLGNLEATNLSGATLPLADGAVRGKAVLYSNEVNHSQEDNTVTTSITQYSVGDFTKRSGFNTADATNHTVGASGKSFLGSDFWGEPQWDENIYAGSHISIMGSVQLSTTSDNTVRAVNLLQLFDSEALSITPRSSTPGAPGSYITQDDVDFGNFYENTYPGHTPQVTYLFAADPSRPNGYDTNADGVVTYMNTVRETDLVYANKLYWNEADHCYNIVKYDMDGDGIDETEFTCVGVLSEVRNCHFLDYCYVRIPVTVADQERFVNQTVCTVNAAEAWIDEGAMNGVSWLNGQWDSQAGKNTLAGYVDITYAWKAGGNGYYSYNDAGSFAKVEYTDGGQYDKGTAGKKDGASLLILGYKAKVKIDNQKHLTPPNYYSSYAPAQGETSVTWVVQNIETEVGIAQGTTAAATTSLTIPVNLEYGGSVDAQQQDLFYITANSSTITELVWEADENGKLIPVYETDKEGNPIVDTNGNPIQKTEVKSVSTDSENPTTITFRGTYKDENGVTQYRLYTYTIYAVRNADKTGVTYHIDGAPVGQTLPEISFNMNLGNSLVNEDGITATAAISGSGDKRAYSNANGNQYSNAISISKIGGSDLRKAVNISYGEINASMEYTVTFTNTSSESLAKAYFYDNLPYNGDGRGSVYDMGEDGTVTDGTIVKEISFRSVTGGELTNDFQATVTVYYPRGSDADAYSKMSDTAFRELMYGFRTDAVTEEGSPSAAKIDALLASQQFGELMKAVPTYKKDADGKYLLSDGTPTDTAPTDETASQYQRTASYRRTLAVKAGWLSYDDNGNEVWAEGPVTTSSGNIYPDGRAAYEAFLSTIPGVVVKVENMGPSRSIEMKITMGTNENKAGDVYDNDAWQWSVGSSNPLRSNPVETEIIGRTISGRVWVDKNLNGVYDAGEKLLNGVTCTLFKWNEETSKYEPCTTDVAGRPLGTVTTGSYDYTYKRESTTYTVEAYQTSAEDSDGKLIYRDEHGHEVNVTTGQKADGQYQFAALPEGKYIVAFSGNALEGYGGATSYQVHLKNDDVSNDGVALFDTEDSNLDTVVSQIPGITGPDSPYRYAIAYDLTGNNTVENMSLHSIADIVNNSIGLTNSVELYDHQDLGLVDYAGFAFPETGGAGITLYMTGGLLLMLAAVFLLLFIHKKCGKEEIASS